MEVNTRLVERPELLAAEGDGYVAAALPKMENIDAIKAGLFSVEQYAELQLKTTTVSTPEESQPILATERDVV